MSEKSNLVIIEENMKWMGRYLSDLTYSCATYTERRSCIDTARRLLSDTILLVKQEIEKEEKGSLDVPDWVSNT